MPEETCGLSATELRQIDLLVDNELSDTARRALLASFAGRPDAWRHCALAFIEAQSWGQALAPRLAAKEAPLPPSATEHVPVVAARNIGQAAARTYSAWQWPLAMAASFLLAFGLAWTWRPAQLVSQAPVAPRTDTAQLAAAPAVMQTPAVGGDGAAVSDAAWRTVTLVMQDGDHAQQLRLPVVPVSDSEADLLERPQPVVPDELREALERMGHRVEQRRQLVPVVLEDGRQLIVPVDEAEFTSASQRIYQ